MDRFKRHFPLYLVVGAVITLWTLIIGARGTVARAEIRSRIAVERSAIARLDAESIRRQDVQLQLDALNQNFQNTVRGLATVSESDRLLTQIRQIAEINSLSVDSLKTISSAQLGDATIRIFNVKIRGGFNGFYAGLLQMESVSPSLAVSDLRLQRLEQGDAELTADLTVRLLLRWERSPTSAGVSP